MPKKWLSKFHKYHKLKYIQEVLLQIEYIYSLNHTEASQKIALLLIITS